tara:strand:+ start:285 stop:1202 length:918 start_codon:yes stop_codon:yes gene_type:complete
MRVVIVGMGVQGLKRKKVLGKYFKYSVDKFKKANFKKIQKVPLDDYDAVFVCVPDNQKLSIIEYCLKNKKHVLVEKPLLSKNKKKLKYLINLSKAKKTILYTAYNHRFEPNIVKMKELIKSKKLGKLYKCKIFYGNGTSLLVRKSKWRDKGMGVLSDIGSHLIDICIFWFGDKIKSIKVFEKNKFENKSFDHFIFLLVYQKIQITLEMSLCMWKNTFTCDVIGSKGSAHLNSLCKWSKSNYIYRSRKLPSGLPKEKRIAFKKGDQTWKKEHDFFKKLIKKKTVKNTSQDILINNYLFKLKSQHAL